MTFSDDGDFEFEILTEHVIPENGFLTITLPEEMSF